MVEEKNIGNDFKYLIIMNCPYIAKTFYAAPMSELDDGTNDIIMMNMDRSRWKFFNFLLSMEEGNYFDGPKGKLSDSYRLQYMKSTKWNLKPRDKGPVPVELNYNLPQGVVTAARNVFGIDGEKYPAQDISATVMK